MKKQIESLLGQLSKAQMDAKAISARLTELENELNKKTANLMSEIKVRFVFICLSMVRDKIDCRWK